jgi:hypothetical protein
MRADVIKPCAECAVVPVPESFREQHPILTGLIAGIAVSGLRTAVTDRDAG